MDKYVENPLHDLLDTNLRQLRFLGNRICQFFLGHEQFFLAKQNVPVPSRLSEFVSYW
jgi:hypothetical protein